LLVFGLVLVIMMLLRPEGLFPSGRRKMELHAAEDSDIQPFISVSEDPLSRANETHSLTYNPSIGEETTLRDNDRTDQTNK
jgi:branched-chain amino acid transport system permease protein